MTSIAANFVRFPPPAEALDRALLFPGTALLKVATNGGGSTIMAGGNYVGISMLIQMDNDCPRCIIWDGGRERGFEIAFHPNPVGNGNPAVMLIAGADTVQYAARYEFDPRSPVGQKVYNSLEAEYLRDVGWKLWWNGVLLTPAQVGGTHNDMSGTHTTHIALGGARNNSITRFRGSVHVPTIVGASAAWDSGTTSVDFLKGAVGYLMIEREPGIPRFEARFQDELWDEVNPGFTTSPNNATNGFRWGEGTASPPAIAYVWTRPILSGRTDEDLPLPAETPLNLTTNASPASVEILLRSTSLTPIVLSSITTSNTGTGVTFDNYRNAEGVPLLLSDSIAPGSSVRAFVNVTRSAPVTDRVGGVTFDLGTGGIAQANFRVTVAATSQPDPRRPLFILGLRRFDRQVELTSPMSVPLTGI